MEIAVVRNLVALVVDALNKLWHLLGVLSMYENVLLFLCLKKLSSITTAIYL